jgi:hypothetical protein
MVLISSAETPELTGKQYNHTSQTELIEEMMQHYFSHIHPPSVSSNSYTIQSIGVIHN